MKSIFACVSLAALVGLIASANAAIVLYDDFEPDSNDFASDPTTGGYTNTNDVTAAQSDGFTSGAVNSDIWVKASNGFGASRAGLVDEAHGDFTDAVGTQAFAFRYTNSGLTTQEGLLGTVGSLASGTVITVTLDVVIDLDADTNNTPYHFGLVTFTPGASRTDMNGGPLDLADGINARLASTSGDAIAFGDPGYLSYQQVTLIYTVGDTIEAGTLNALDDIALRIDGATDTAIIDNVTIDITAVPEAGTTALLGLAGFLFLRRRRS